MMGFANAYPSYRATFQSLFVQGMNDFDGIHDNFPMLVQFNLEGQILKAGVFADFFPLHIGLASVRIGLNPISWSPRPFLVK